MSKEEQMLIEIELKNYIQECMTNTHYVPDWYEILGYCLGYYNSIDLNVLAVVRKLQREGLVR